MLPCVETESILGLEIHLFRPVLMFFLLILSLAGWCEPYKDAAGFQYEPPANWVRGESLWHNGKNSQVLVTDSVKVAGLSLGPWVEAVVKQGPEKKWQDIKVLDTSLGDLPAKCITLTDVSGSKPMFMKMYLVVRESTGSVLTFMSENGDSDVFEESVQGVFQSFRWL